MAGKEGCQIKTGWEGVMAIQHSIPLKKENIIVDTLKLFTT